MSGTHERVIYPFSAIVGQEKMKTALILNAVSPTVGGVLIKGERGTAKSTAVRSLAALLPEQEVVIGCLFNCDPQIPEAMCASCRSRNDISITKQKMRVVELPVSATEDKVVGTLDIGAAIKSGDKKFEPGVLADANRNILYVDEINLLNDHIVDVLLDAAAMGVNTIEREGISYTHPSSFILIGTMNPEEGELRPQLLDRFGLCVDIQGISDPDIRLEIINRKMGFDDDPKGFVASWANADKEIADRIVKAKLTLPSVKISKDMLRVIVDLCISFDVDGHRGDIAMMKATRALAAYEGRDQVIEADIRTAADMVLLHRMRKTPFSNVTLDAKKISSIISNPGEHVHKHDHVHDHAH